MVENTHLCQTCCWTFIQSIFTLNSRLQKMVWLRSVRLFLRPRLHHEQLLIRMILLYLLQTKLLVRAHWHHTEVRRCLPPHVWPLLNGTLFSTWKNIYLLPLKSYHLYLTRGMLSQAFEENITLFFFYHITNRISPPDVRERWLSRSCELTLAFCF